MSSNIYLLLPTPLPPLHLLTSLCRGTIHGARLKLSNLRQLAHRSQAARTDVDVARCTVDLKTSSLHVEHEASACAMLRMWYIVAIHRLSLAYITTTCRHFYPPSKISTDAPVNFWLTLYLVGATFMAPVPLLLANF